MAGRKQTFKGSYVEEMCRQFPEIPTLSLAKKIFADQPDLFKDVEAARTYVRMYRGESKSRSSNFKQHRITPQSTPKSKSILPQSFAHKKEPFHLPQSSKKVLILSDIHIPYQDNEAIIAACEYGKSKGIDTVYLNGDILDIYDLSFHEKDPKKRPTFADELEMGRQLLEWLRDFFPTEQIYYIPGNHENRIKRWLAVKSPQWIGVHEVELAVLLGLADLGIHWLEHKSKVYFGKLLVEHGDKMSGSGGVNPAKTLLDRFKRSAICGHFHRTNQFNGKIYDGDIMMAWSTGCLCELEPEYMEVNQHNHGAAIVEIFKDGKYRVDNFQIIDGRVY